MLRADTVRISGPPPAQANHAAESRGLIRYPSAFDTAREWF